MYGQLFTTFADEWIETYDKFMVAIRMSGKSLTREWKQVASHHRTECLSHI